MIEPENSANSQKGLAKLLEVLRDSIIGIIKPSQLEKIALAQASVASIASTSAFKTALKQNLANEISQMTHSAREIRQFHNIANVYAYAAQELQMIDGINDTPVSSEWSAIFFDYAQDICEEDAQVIWAKILAGEIAKPGSFHKRTLSVLRNIETFEAKWFADICQFVFLEIVIHNYCLLFDYFPINQFQSLIDCGLINSIECQYLLDKETTEINGKTHSIKLTTPQMEMATKIVIDGVYTLTDSGAQLYRITPAKSHQTYMMKLKEDIEKTYNVKAELVHIVQ